MRIKLSEQANPRYIYVNQETNTVHLLVPVTSGTEVALDNTCKTVVALQEFFGKKHDSEQRQNSARHELLRFKWALERDIQALPENETRRLKVDRLNQVQAYINTLNRIGSHPSLNQLSGAFPRYPEPIQHLLARPESNLYAMRLRPSALDSMLRTQNPTFTVNRERDSGTLYHALRDMSVTRIASVGHKEHFTNRVLNEFKNQTYPIAAGIMSAQITGTLSETHKKMFGDAFTLDFTISSEDLNILDYDDDNSLIENQAELEGIINMQIERSTETDAFPLESSFNELTMPFNTEKCSIMVQFLLGEINIYARGKGLTQSDFGAVLDSKPVYTNMLTAVVTSALEGGRDVEQSVCEFINDHSKLFGLSSRLTSSQIADISTRFNSHYQVVKESPHMDEFMILDPAAAGQGRFFTHQNSICLDFVDLMTASVFSPYNEPAYEAVRDEVSRLPGIIPARDNDAVGYIDVDPEVFKTAIKVGLRENNFAEVRKILSLTDDGRTVFEVLGRTFFSEFDANEQSQQLLVEVRRGIIDATTLNHFNSVVRGLDAQILLTPEMARQLYVAVAATKALTPERTLQYSTVEAVKALLGDVGVTNVVATAGYNGDIVIDTSTQNMTRITAILNDYTHAIHLTNSMAASLYKQVEESYGLNNPQYKEMMALRNGLEGALKLKKALDLLHVGIQNVSYPNNNQGENGYIIRNIDPEELRIIEEIHEAQGNRFVLTPTMEQSLYERIRALDIGTFNTDLAPLNNAVQPNKLETALVLLGITYRRVEFGTSGEYVIYMPASEQAKIKFIANQARNVEEVALTRNFQPSILPATRKSHRGYMINAIRERARLNAGAETAVARREAPLRTRGEPGRAATGVAPMVPSPSANQINIARVMGFGAVSTTVPQRINPERVQLNCPAHIHRAFQELLRGSRILGARFTNPYTNQVEQFPTQVEELTPRHLHMLARLEAVNTTGIMNIGQYNGLLDENQIAGVRALVKATTVAGITYAERFGGYHTLVTSLATHHKVIVIDQSGLQWQGDMRNTGGLFFYPADGAAGVSRLPEGYLEWQRTTYQAMYHDPRPEVSSNSITVSWSGTRGLLDLNGVARGIELEFAQALDAAVAQGQYLDASERINFAFLKAGMGFFASGLGLSEQNQRLLASARLQGILNALQTLQRRPQEERAAILGKLGRIELPYSAVGGSVQLLAQIRETVLAMGLEWGGADPVGGYVLRPGWVTATTNCGDPHAMPGNEGGYQSVDAEMGSNAYLDHLNATFNARMAIRLTPSFYPSRTDATYTEVSSAATLTPQSASTKPLSAATGIRGAPYTKSGNYVALFRSQLRVTDDIEDIEHKYFGSDASKLGGVFGEYLEERSKTYWFHDLMGSFAALVLGCFGYKSDQQKRESFLDNLKNKYQQSGSDAAQVLIAEGKKLFAPRSKSEPEYEKSLCFKLSEFETAINKPQSDSSINPSSLRT